MIKTHPSYQYARAVLRGEKKAPKYVILQCAQFVHVAGGESKKYVVDEEKLQVIENLLELMIMPKGLKARQTVRESLAGFQRLFIVAVLCTVWRDNREKRRYQTAILEICRKNGKTFLVAVIFILLFLTEPKFSKGDTAQRKVRNCAARFFVRRDKNRSKYCMYSRGFL